MGVITAIGALCALAILVLILRNIRLEWYPAAFFALKFLGSHLIGFDRVRYFVVFQIGVVALLLMVACARYGMPRRRETALSVDGTRVFAVFTATLGLFAINGVIHGNALTQVFIDAYKYLEIPVLFALFRFCWRTSAQIDGGIRAFTATMLALGVVEIFITTRGGVGLNLIVSFLPIVLTLGLAGRFRSYLACLIPALLVVALCETRTYIMCVVAGLLLVYLAARPGNRFALVNALLIMAVAGAGALALMPDSGLGETVGRFMELSGGFEEAGGYRAAELAVAVRFILQAPVFGWGLGFMRTVFIDQMGTIAWGDFVHNFYVENLLKNGIVGTTFLLALAALFLRLIRGAAASVGGPEGERVRLIMRGGFIATASWALIYAFAPLTTAGSVFVGAIVAYIAADVALQEQAAGEKASSAGAMPVAIASDAGAAEMPRPEACA